MPSAKELLKGLRLSFFSLSFSLFFFFFIFSNRFCPLSFPFFLTLDCLGCCIYDVRFLLFNAVMQYPLNIKVHRVFCAPRRPLSSQPCAVTQWVKSYSGVLKFPLRFLIGLSISQGT